MFENNNDRPTKNFLTGFLLSMIIATSLTVGFLIPIPSPLEEESQQEVKKAPTKVAPIPPAKVLIDLNEDDIPEWYYFFPANEDEEE